MLSNVMMSEINYVRKNVNKKTKFFTMMDIK